MGPAESTVLVAGEPELLLGDVPGRAHEADQPGGGRGRGGGRLLPRVPGHAGGVSLSQGLSQLSLPCCEERCAVGAGDTPYIHCESDVVS